MKSYIQDDHLFDAIIAARGFEGADTLYAMQKHGTKMLEAAQAAGVRTVVDVFITPMCSPHCGGGARQISGY